MQKFYTRKDAKTSPIHEYAILDESGRVLKIIYKAIKESLSLDEFQQVQQ